MNDNNSHAVARLMVSRALSSLGWFLQFMAVVLAFSFAARGEEIDLLALDGQSIGFYKNCHALVVGVEHYQKWPPRSGAVEAARDVSWELRRLGFSVRLLTDPTAKELRSVLHEFVQGVGDEIDRGLVFYFCAHSRILTSADGGTPGWIVPVDGPPPSADLAAFNESALGFEELSAIAGQLVGRHALFLLDMPFSAQDFRIEPAVLKIISEDSMLSARQVIAAGGADEPVSAHNDFAKFLLAGLGGEADLIQDGAISASELGLYLSNRISSDSGETLHPQYGRLSVFGENSGDFIFRFTDRKLDIARLFVDAQPDSATIRIMNIKPRFEQGMELVPGHYRVNVSADGYEAVDQWIDLEAGENRIVKITLPKETDEMTNSLGMRFMRIRPGRFVMGSPASEPGRSTDETRHPVRLTRPFFMQNSEVTVGQFKQFVQSTGYRSEAEKGGGCWIATGGAGWRQKPGTHWQKPGLAEAGDRRAVNCITWNDAVAFARWLSKKEGRTYRLPSEAEWEYACRAGTETPFSTGRCLSTDEANYGKTGHDYQRCMTVFRENRGRVLDAGSLAPNPWKLFNIHGNVSEWCLDRYGLYASGHTANPQGPLSGSERVMRGGHWQAEAAGCRSAKRWRFPPNMASDVLGFRLVMEY